MEVRRDNEYQAAFQLLDKLKREGKTVDLITKEVKAYFWDVYDAALKEGRVREFDNREWSLIKRQRFLLTNAKAYREKANVLKAIEERDFLILYKLGENINEYFSFGEQLSYSYSRPALATGRMSFQRSVMSEKDLRYEWIIREYEVDGKKIKEVIDPRLCIVLDAALLKDFGYIVEENGLRTADELEGNATYQNRKKSANGEKVDWLGKSVETVEKKSWFRK